VDVAIRIGRLADSSMVATRLGAVSWVTCASPDYLAARGTPATPASLDRHDLVMFDGLYSTRVWRFGRGERAEELAIAPRFAVNTAEAAIAASIAGAGITRVLSYQVRAAEAEGSLRIILREFEPEPLPVHLVHGGQALLPLKLRAFLDFTSPRLEASLRDESQAPRP
jgi:DNA-binding transcriptional LysR family regulator